MDNREAKCKAFMIRLAELLKDSYTLVPSCNGGISAYLVPKGTESQVTYYGKPERSFRISDHWSWYSSLSKCPNAEIVQCPLKGYAPTPRDPAQPGKYTLGRKAMCVAYCYGGEYLSMYGDDVDNFYETKPEAVLKVLRGMGMM